MKIEIALMLSALLPASLALATEGEPPPDLTGPLTRAELEKPDYPWMKSGLESAKNEYAKQKDNVKKLGKKIGATEVEIYLATWCGDSHDHVPPFVALIDETKRQTKAEPKSVKFFALDKRKKYEGYTNPRKIEKLPTFVFLRDGKEIGRIVETPKKSVIDDTIAIVSAK